MRYPAAEKLEIIRLVEQSHLPVRRTLAKIGEYPKLCVSDRAHAVFRYGQASKRPANIMAS